MSIFGFIANKKVLAYLGGLATATLGVKLLKSEPVRKAAVRTLAGGMKLRDNAMSAFETMKEDAQDLYHEACQQETGEEEEQSEEK